MADREPITPQGYERLVKEIEHIKHVERPANITALEEARAHGDLSENADYDAAKNNQGLIQARLNSLEDKLARAEIIDPKQLSGDSVTFGATVQLVDLDGENTVTYKLVGSYEADAKANLISIESPIGRALIGKSVSDEVVVQTPNGKREFAIEKIFFK